MRLLSLQLYIYITHTTHTHAQCGTVTLEDNREEESEEGLVYLEINSK